MIALQIPRARSKDTAKHLQKSTSLYCEIRWAVGRIGGLQPKEETGWGPEPRALALKGRTDGFTQWLDFAKVSPFFLS